MMNILLLYLNMFYRNHYILYIHFLLKHNQANMQNIYKVQFINDYIKYIYLNNLNIFHPNIRYKLNHSIYILMDMMYIIDQNLCMFYNFYHILHIFHFILNNHQYILYNQFMKCMFCMVIGIFHNLYFKYLLLKN